MIVRVWPVVAPRVAFEGLDSVTVNVSFGSSSASLTTVTAMFFDVVSCGMVIVPEAECPANRERDGGERADD